MRIYHLKSPTQEGYYNAVHDINQRMKKQPGFVRYYSPSCPHCVDMENDWNLFEKQINEDYPNDNGSIIVSSQPECMKDLDFFNSPRGFPGLYSVNGDDVVEFNEGPRISENFRKFYEREVLNKAKKAKKPKSKTSKQSKKGKRKQTKGKKAQAKGKALTKKQKRKQKITKKGGRKNRKKTRRVRFKL